MAEFTVEKVTENNLARLANEMYMDATYAKRVGDMLAKDEVVVFAALHDGSYVARCTLWLAQADEPELRDELPGVPLVGALEVHPDFYRRGLASLLIAALEDEAKQRGKTRLALGVEPQNTPGRKLYEKLGFHYASIGGAETYPCFWYETLPDGTAKRNSIDALLMVKAL